MGIFSCRLQTIISRLKSGYLRCQRLSEGLCCPLLNVLVCLGGLPTVDVPRQIHNERNLLLGRFYVAHVEHPYLARAEGVCLRKFCSKERRRKRTEPYPTGGVAMIGKVVIDACTALALLLLGIREVAAVPMLVVAPQQRNVIGHLQSVVVCIEHLLVCAQHLRNLLYRFVDVSPQHVALVVNRLLHQPHTFFGAVGSLHGIVVDAAQSQGVGVLIFPVGLDARLPVVLHRLAVGNVVEVAQSALALSLGAFVHCLPLALVVAQHLLAMRRAHHDGIVVCKTRILRVIVKCLCSGMHGGP